MRMKRIMILAVAAIALVACSRTFETHQASEPAIGFGTWTDVMTKTPKTAFSNGDAFDIYGYKWKGTIDSQTDKTTVFNGDDVTYDGSDWKYTTGLRYWDTNFDAYTFYASHPANYLASADAQTGIFVSNNLDFNGENEPLLIAQRNTVYKGGAPHFNNYGVVPLVFKHMSSLVDIKIRKASAIKEAVLTVTSVSLNNIQTRGHFTVASYSGDNDPVGSAGAGGWELADPAVPGVYTNADGTAVSLPTLATNEIYEKGTAVDIIKELVVLPQILNASAQQLHIEYTLTSGGDATAHEVDIDFRDFDIVENNVNTDANIPSWLPGVHYTYYLIVDANAINFSASIASWSTNEGFYYLVN